MSVDSETVLVVGGAGYIGAHACKCLAANGYEPVVYDSLELGHREAVKWGAIVEGNLLDRDALNAAFAAHKPSAVMHFAAYAEVGESMREPGKYYRNNVVGTLNLLEAMRANGAERIVFSSTCATYGVPERVPIPEDHPQRPVNPYGASKLMVERMLDDYESIHGFRSAALRYFNAAGADPEGEIGEDHDPETHLIPLALDAASGRREAIEIFGTDYPTPDGSCVRDYIHVADLAEAHVAALEILSAETPSIRLNLGTGHGHSVREVIAAAEAVSGRKIQSREGERRAGDPPELVADASRAAQLLGWRPRFADLHTIVEHAWAWHVKRFGGDSAP